MSRRYAIWQAAAFIQVETPSVRIHFAEQADGMLMNSSARELASRAFRNQPSRR